MTSNFNWQTDDDSEWEGTAPPGTSSRRRKRWLWTLAVMAAILIAASAVFWQLRQQVTAAEAARADDIISSFHLIRQALDEDDKELFRNLLSGSDLQWAMAQQELFSAGWLFDLRAFGLLGRPAGVEQVEVTMSPKFDSGEVTALATYQVAIRGAVSETVQLQQTSVFRQGNRWVWSPPRDEFWGEDGALEGKYLTIDYPKRDDAIVTRLHQDMDELVGHMCETISQLVCPSGLRIHIELRRDPAALLELTEEVVSQGIFWARAGGTLDDSRQFGLSLPTPSLVGVPIDEAGFQVLLRGYATHLAAGLANRLIDPECCGTESRYRAAVQVMLRDLGLQAWRSAISDLTGAEEAQSPSSHVALLCSDGFERRQQMFTLDLATGNWQARPMDLDQIAIKSVPGRDGVLLLGQQTDGNRFRSQVWHRSTKGDDLLFDLSVTAAEASQISWELQERQKRLVIEVPNLTRGFSRFFTLDLEQCLSGECPADPESTVSRPIWSPEGRQMLVRAYGLLWWRQGNNLVQIANGTAPFWINEDVYGYVRPIGREQAVVLVDAVQRQREAVVLTTDDLRRAFEPGEQPARLLIGRVLVPYDRPADEDASQGGKWLILAFEIGRQDDINQARIMAYDPGSGQVSIVSHAGRLLTFNWAASGLRLAIGGYDEGQNQWVMTVDDQTLPEPIALELAPGASAGAIPSYSWSADEQWLLILEQGELILLHPATGAVQKIVPPEPGCVQAAWYGEADEITRE